MRLCPGPTVKPVLIASNPKRIANVTRLSLDGAPMHTRIAGAFDKRRVASSPRWPAVAAIALATIELPQGHNTPGEHLLHRKDRLRRASLSH